MFCGSYFPALRVSSQKNMFKKKKTFYLIKKYQWNKTKYSRKEHKREKMHYCNNFNKRNNKTNNNSYYADFMVINLNNIYEKNI